MKGALALGFALVISAGCGDDDSGSGIDASAGIDAPVADAFASVDATAPPGDVPGLTLWLDAASITGLSDGDPIETWNDSSGNHNDATQPLAASQPAYRRFVSGSEHAVRFDGVDDVLTLEVDPVRDATAFTIIAVARRDESVLGAGESVVAFGEVAPSLALDYGAHIDTPHARVVDSLGVRAEVSAQSRHPELGVIALTRNGGAIALFVDGARVGAQTVDYTGAFAWSDLRVGGFAGDLSEVLVYDRALTPGERETVEAVLYARYGLAASGDEPLLINEIAPARLWLAADMIDAPVGESVALWRDYSGSANDATPAGTGPLLATNAQNAEPVARFSGAEDLAMPNDPVGGLSAYTIVAVARRDASVGTGSAVIGLRDSGTTGCQLDFSGTLEDRPRFVVRDSDAMAGAVLSPTPRADMVVITGARSGPIVTLRVNGTLVGTATGEFTGTFPWTDHGVGSIVAASDLFFGGEIAELVVYEGILGETDLSAVEQHLAAKYNVIP